MSTTVSTTPITEHEQEQVDRANATTATPVVFVHGLWLLPSSWQNWADLFEEAGYVAVAPGWPDDPETVAEAKEDPELASMASELEADVDRLENELRLALVERDPADGKDVIVEVRQGVGGEVLCYVH